MIANFWIGFSPANGCGIHSSDLAYVTAHNKVTESADHQLVTHAWPQPWAGDITRSRVVILSANPGWSAGDAACEAKLAQVLSENLSGQRPNMWLDQPTSESPGAEWTRERLLKDVLAAFPERVVAESVCVVDFHAYHSKKWLTLPVTLPTQLFTFQQVRQLLVDDALVVITRAARQWQVAVPELVDHPNVLRTKSAQNTRISPRNIGDEGWRALTSRLQGSRRA